VQTLDIKEAAAFLKMYPETLPNARLSQVNNYDWQFR
jgi:hypothetical protein